VNQKENRIYNRNYITTSFQFHLEPLSVSLLFVTPNFQFKFLWYWCIAHSNIVAKVSRIQGRRPSDFPNFDEMPLLRTPPLSNHNTKLCLLWICCGFVVQFTMQHIPHQEIRQVEFGLNVLLSLSSAVILFSAAVIYLQFTSSGLFFSYGAVTGFPDFTFSFQSVNCINRTVFIYFSLYFRHTTRE